MKDRMTTRHWLQLAATTLLTALLATTPAPATKANPSEAFVFTDYLTMPRVGIYGRAAVHIDAVDAAIAAGELTQPAAGDTLTASDGRVVEWKPSTATDGNLSTRSIVGGYAAATYESPADQVMLLEARGHAVAYVNGHPHAGDPYAMGNWQLPVRLKKGANTFIFHVAQREFTARLLSSPSQALLTTTFGEAPSLVAGTNHEQLLAAISVLNVSNQPIEGAELVARLDDASESTPLAWLDAASMRIAPLTLPAVNLTGDNEGESIEIEVTLMADGQTLAEQTLKLSVVDSTAVRTCTFRSTVDGSVQSYALLPAASQGDSSDPPGILLALHGAGSTAKEFVANYAAKPWAHIVAPNGRSKYPFDWEDWARHDALEALDDAAERFDANPQKIYVTGHAMGGHGALVLATSAPSRFAAVGTSAAWPSLWTYGGGMPDYRDPNPVQAMLRRAANPSDTLQLLENLREAGVYLLHGEEDKRVPVEQTRMLLKKLTEFHDDFAFHEKEKAGNWWGNTTVDWPDMMEFFADRNRSAQSPERVVLATSDLGVTATSQWVTIAGQARAFEISRVDLSKRTSPVSIVGKTENVTRIMLHKSAVPAGEPFAVRLDDSRPVIFRGMPASGTAWLEKVEGQWQRARSPNRNYKNPNRYGGIKAAFHRNALLVYGTQGSEEENRWSRAKAHFDAQTFAYRAGGSFEVIPDTKFDERSTRDRNVVLYGNVDTNAAWPALLSTSPVQARRSSVEVGMRHETGEGLGLLMVRPRSRSAESLVGAIGGTNLTGMQLTNRLRYFWSGVAYPDLTLLGPNSLTLGDRDVRAAGYFADDWKTDDADIAWRDTAL